MTSTVSRASPEGSIIPNQVGVVSWNYNPALTSTASAATSGTIYAVGVPYRRGQVVTNIGFLLNVAASGNDPTSIYVGLASATTMLAGSADHNASALWDSTGRWDPLTVTAVDPSLSRVKESVADAACA